MNALINNKPRTKAYQNVLEKIKDYIQIDQLKPGDRLPSEREMAEDLKLSRSTVREGLRAIELLGLIETRRGEGTFLRPYQSYQTLSLLAGFIFQDAKTKENVDETLVMIENLIVDLGRCRGLSKIQHKWSGHGYSYWCRRGYKATFEVILDVMDNQLLEKIWYLLYAFYLSIEDKQHIRTVKDLFKLFDVEIKAEQ
ncbi:GntR family transcriptional regulator [Halolactibacillus alkaliphilus]|uniref:GntR family transcriptional regulator n=1 Tax=Halolactibacillus alkaliphilus TaxID=442899 RepID=A0A511X2Z9_9BACI|nr:GntR family transcriptional regulator [Halolactibacillus alkaliphilus]GEN57312.1 GntR family transcriptional regulator [Halolactibacillus alkaliphilus]GGN72829.1 GntR family transcriptional regulator [Halolactibacillus alkaliphilus]SFO93451.1 regulatory protein, gntR family [Halolactibacillus alkaliphilus]